MFLPGHFSTLDSRFRSPVVPRKVNGADETTTAIAKKSKRSKSTEHSLEKADPFTRMGPRENEHAKDPMTTLNKRWSLIARNQETMSKQELLNNYRLLMNDHLRLERFLSIITKDNEMARNRLETDLLDAMMCIEDLKQALEVRMARRRKIDPREAEERRSLIRQNKKLLNQLYESAKKIETLELAKLEMKEQLELLDFQMVELENQKAIVEEELRRQPPCEDGSTQTEEDAESGAGALAAARAEKAALAAELANQQAEAAALSAKHRHLEGLVRELRRDNAELREQINHTNDDDDDDDDEEEEENALAESDKHTRNHSLKAELEAKTQRLNVLEERLAKAEAANESLKTQLNEIKGNDFMDAVESQGLRLSAEAVEKLTAELEGIEELNADNLIESVCNLKRLRNSLLSTSSRTNLQGDAINGMTSPEYYSNQFNQLQGSSEVEGLRGQLTVCEKRRADLEKRLADLSSELTQAQAANRANEAALTASRRNEAALRRRLLATMDPGSATSQRVRPISSLDYSGASPNDLRDELDAMTKVIKLETENTALMEASHLDRARLQEQATRIAQLEAEQRTLHDRMANLQASESCAQRASVRLQQLIEALYEDMLREFSESTTNEASAASRRRQRLADPRGYETDSAVANVILRSNAERDCAKTCNSKTCVETREALRCLQGRFIRAAEQLAEAETLLAEVGSGGARLRAHPSPGAGEHLMAALKAAASGDEGVRLHCVIDRLGRWIGSQLARRDALEGNLRQKYLELEVEMSKNASEFDSKVLKAHLEAQKAEVADLYHKLEALQDELEATKASLDVQLHDAQCSGTRIDVLETI